jgi:hypothetical protein
LRKAYAEVVASEANRKRAKDGAIKDVIDFDVFTDAKDYRITELKFSSGSPGKSDADKTKSRADFKNNGTPMHLEFDMVRVGDAWKISDIHWLHRNASLKGLIAELKSK